MADANLHHVHLFCRDIETTLVWWTEMLDGKVAYDGIVAGQRNVFMTVGDGRLHLYNQPPRGDRGGAVHHVGIRTDDLHGLVERMKARGQEFRSEIREFGAWRYIMVAAPDDLLLELFEWDASDMEPALNAYFGTAPYTKGHG
jgi:catechol 2,3-dioxygenase-like lactoylglutathione lyase family enzyme